MQSLCVSSAFVRPGTRLLLAARDQPLGQSGTDCPVLPVACCCDWCWHPVHEHFGFPAGPLLDVGLRHTALAMSASASPGESCALLQQP